MPAAVVVSVTLAVAAEPVAGSTTARLSATFASLSLSNTLPVTTVSVSVALISSTASGDGSVIRKVIVPLSVPPLPSSIVYGSCTVPVKPGTGVKAASPVTGSTSSVPCVVPVARSIIVIGPADGSIPSTAVIVSVSPLASVSFSSRFAVAICPVTDAARSLPASGLLLIAGFESAVMFSVAVA